MRHVITILKILCNKNIKKKLKKIFLTNFSMFKI